MAPACEQRGAAPGDRMSRLVQMAMLILLAVPGLAADEKKAFSIIVLPDTQCYADTRLAFSLKHWKTGDLRKNFFKQTEWIKANRETLNIAMVLHVGDIVQSDYDEEWQIADQAFKALDNVVPYCLAVGNHDMGFKPAASAFSWPKFAVTRDTSFNKYFGPARFQGKPWYGGHMGPGNENSFCLFDAGGMKFLVISLEFKPTDGALKWANRVAAEHADRRGIVLTHAFLDDKGLPSRELDYGVKGNAGQAVWERFVSPNRNLFLVLCGHEFGERRRAMTGKNGNPVLAISANYEDQHGGEGYLRIMTFAAESNRIDVTTYSPVLDKYRQGPDSRFSLP
jgi:hypothetical protein